MKGSSGSKKMAASVLVLVLVCLAWKAQPAVGRLPGTDLREILMVTEAGVGGDWCQEQNESCYWSQTCCTGYCSAWTDGTCICVGEGGQCGLQHGCCANYYCDGNFFGTCISRAQG